MRKLIWVTISLLIFSFSENGVANDLETTKMAELNQVHGQISVLQKSVQKNQQLQVGLEQQLKSVEIKIGKLGQQIYQFNLALNKEKRIIADLKKQQQIYIAQLATQDAALAQQVRAAYQLGQVQQWKVLLNQVEISSVSRHFAYYHYLGQARLQVINSIKQILTSLATSIQISNAHEATLQKIVAQKQQQQNLEQRVLALRQKLLVALGQQTKNKQQQIDLLVTNQQALQKTLTRLKAQRISLSGQTFAQLRGKLSWPVRGSMASTFGTPIDASEQKLNGVVIKAAPGTPVHAISGGKIIFADWLRGFGLLVIINHGNNYMSLYARNRAILTKVGSIVNAGDVIAETGNSGGYNKSSLYFEIRQNGSPVNPSSWCR